ncbi:hypothetical protein Tco_1105202 [Tanacetum coccineum]
MDRRENCFCGDLHPSIDDQKKVRIKRDTFLYKSYGVYNKEAKTQVPKSFQEHDYGKMDSDESRWTSTSENPELDKWQTYLFGLRKRTRAFWSPTLARPEGLYRTKRAKRSSNSGTQVPVQPGNVQEMLQQQYELERKMKQTVLALGVSRRVDLI